MFSPFRKALLRNLGGTKTIRRQKGALRQRTRRALVEALEDRRLLTVSLQNPSFELVGVGPLKPTTSLYTPLGWNGEASGTSGSTDLRIQDSSAPSGFESNTATQGSRFLRLASDPVGLNGQGAVNQDAGQMVAGETYQLTGDAFQRLTGSTIVAFSPTIEFRRGSATGPVLAATTISPGLNPGLRSFSLSYTATTLDAGQELFVRIKTNNAGSGRVTRGGIDNLRLVTLANARPTIVSNSAAVSVNEGGTATNTGTFSDPQGNSTVTLSASIGTVTQNNTAGTWSWSLNAVDGPAGPFTVTITATDNQGNAANTTFTYAIQNVPPTISLSGDATVDEGSLYTLNLGAVSDPGLDSITSYKVNWGDGTISTFSGSPANTTATHVFADGPATQTNNVTVTDEDGTFIAGSLSVQVLNVAPNVFSAGSVSFDEGSTATNTGSWVDPGQDDVTLSSSIGTITKNADGTWFWSFSTNDGPDLSQTVSITATDSDGDSSSTSFELIVNNVAPTVTTDESVVTVAEGLIASNSGSFSDPGDDTVTLSASFGTVTQVASGNGFDVRLVRSNLGHVFNLAEAEALLATPAYQAAVFTENVGMVNYLGSGGSGHFLGDNPFPGTSIGANTDYFAVEANGSVYIPAAGVWTFGTNSDDGIKVEVGSNNLVRDGLFPPTDTFAAFNFPSAGTYPLRLVFFEHNGGAEVELFAAQGSYNAFNSNFRLVGDTANGGLATSGSGATGGWSWSANTTDGPIESQTVTITATDSDGATSQTTFNLVVNNVAPDFEAGIGATLLPADAGVFSRSLSFTDPSADSWTGTVNFGDGSGNQALAIDQSSKSFDLNHVYTAEGTFTVSVSVSDDDGGLHSDSFAVTVFLNTPPVAEDDSVTTDEDHSISFNVLTNDHDNQNNIVPSLTTNLTSPAAGTLTNNGDGTFSFSPNGAFESLAVGEHAIVSFEYQVVDAFGASDIGAVTIKITGVNDGPSALVDNTSVTVNEGQSANNSGSWSDIDANDLVELSASIGTVTKNDDGTWNWSFDTSDGPDQSQTVTITANDGHDGTATTTFELVVNNVAPTIALAGSNSVDEGSAYTLNLGSITDPGTDTVSGYSIDWGDGVIESFLGNPASTSQTHIYADGTNIYQIRVSLTDEDGNYPEAGSLSLSVNNVAPSTPADTNTDADEVSENAANGTLVGIQATSTDPGILDTVTYRLTNDAGGRFAIDATTGVVSVANGALLDYEAATSHTITVEATDGSDTSSQSFTINLLNVTAVISGSVFVDVNGNGLYDGGTETGIDGVKVQLLDSALAELAEEATVLGGVYAFTVDDEFGTYVIREVQPTGVADGAAILGSAAVDSVLSSNEMQLTLAGENASDYDFTEVGESVQSGDTATIGFWQNKRGQQLIKQAGMSLVPWLNANFGNIFGTRFSDGIGGDDPTEVASFYKTEFFDRMLKGTSKVDAQFMAVALATYFTSSNLSGGNVASNYGFHVTETGIGTKVVNTRSSGAAFGVANNTFMTIMSLLLATNSLTGADTNGDGYSNAYDSNGDGVLNAEEKALRELANTIYTAINENGDI